MFKNLKIGSRLTAAFALLMTLMLVIASISLLKLAGINDNMQLILKDRFAKTVEANKVIDNVNIIAISLRNMMLTSSAEDRLKQKERVFEARKNIASTIESLEKTLTSPQEKELLQTMLDTRKNYIAGQNKLIELIENSHPDEARASLTNELRPTFAANLAAINKLIDYQTTLMSHDGEAAQQTYEGTRTQLLVLSILAALISIGMAWWITRSITRPLNEAVLAANELAQGNLMIRIEVDSKDETRAIA